uniref:Uncharacterized protein n=1 Tax=Anguilla anguilla TaxID=7936 RepID=A0A0E9W0J6_ANGAN
MAFVQPNTMAIIFAVAFHGIVGEVTLRYFKVGVYLPLVICSFLV